MGAGSLIRVVAAAFVAVFIAAPGPSTTWSIATTQAVGTQSTLSAVDLTSATHGWAVGSTNTTGGLVERWNGQRFARVPSPNILASSGGSAFAGLSGVDAVSSTSAFAVGSSAFYGNDGLEHSRAVAERWNGSHWTRMTVPNHPMINSFQAVKAFSGNDVWSVGRAGDSTFGATLAMHWNGSTWTPFATPSPGTRDNFLLGIAGSGPDDVWAVGYYSDLPYGNRARHSLALHWDGSTWTRVPTPDVGPIQTFLRDVVVLSPTNAWAIGWASGAVNGTTSVSLHWNGSSWAIAPAPPLGTLNSVTALSPTDIWTLGTNSGDGTPELANQRASGWTLTRPTLPPDAALIGVGAAGPGTVIAVGYTTDPTTGDQAPLAIRTDNG